MPLFATSSINVANSPVTANGVKIPPLRVNPCSPSAVERHSLVAQNTPTIVPESSRIGALIRSIDASRNYPLNHFYSAAALAHLGRLDEARAEVKAGLSLAPKFSLARFHRGAESDVFAPMRGV